MDRISDLILNEGNWMPVSMIVALIATAIAVRTGHPALTSRDRITAAINCFFGITIGMMAIGHFSAVTTRLLLGTLEASLAKLYLIGFAFGVPSWWLVAHSIRLLSKRLVATRITMLLNGWLAITLLLLGVSNLPLAAPALFNIGYQLHSRSTTGFAIICLLLVFHVTLFVGALIFLASGQTFEQFTGME